jgi:AraC-like DNA-binding protein/quercetin dioxygenase-like cupin family protein
MAAQQHQPERSVALPASGALRVRLNRYSPGSRHAAHDHEMAHLSVILGGSLREISGREECDPVAGSLFVRAGPSRHSVTFGPAGAIILTLTPPAGALADGTARRRSQWARPDARLRSLVRAMLAAPENEREDLGWDLILAASAGEAPGRTGPPPIWVVQARECLVEEPSASIQALARAAGRHRVSFSRAFETWYGLTPRAFRERAMLDRSLDAVMGGLSGAAAAAEAGFADQSHMNRCARKVLGATPVQLAALLR